MDNSFETWYASDKGRDASEIEQFGSPRVDPARFESVLKRRLEIAFYSGAVSRSKV